MLPTWHAWKRLKVTQTVATVAPPLPSSVSCQPERAYIQWVLPIFNYCCARAGKVHTQGGHVQVGTRLQGTPLAGCEGLMLRARGDGQSYVVQLTQGAPQAVSTSPCFSDRGWCLWRPCPRAAEGAMHASFAAVPCPVGQGKAFKMVPVLIGLQDDACWI